MVRKLLAAKLLMVIVAYKYTAWGRHSPAKGPLDFELKKSTLIEKVVCTQTSCSYLFENY